MRIPFTVDQFYDVFRAYNLAVWPAQWVLVALAAAAVVMLLKPRPWSSMGISAILAFLWAWCGLAYHLAFFSSINPLANAFAGLSLVGAGVFFWQGVVRRQLEFKLAPGTRAWVGAGLIVFSLALYPAWSYYAGASIPGLADVRCALPHHPIHDRPARISGRALPAQSVRYSGFMVFCGYTGSVFV